MDSFLESIASAIELSGQQRAEHIARWKWAFEEMDLYTSHAIQEMLSQGGKLPAAVERKAADAMKYRLLGIREHKAAHGH